MTSKGIEIRYNTGVDNYETILYPITKTSNVIFKESINPDNNISVEEEILSLYNILKNIKISSINYYLCSDDEEVIEINNKNYTYLDSELEVYLNGLLLIQNYHYIIYNKTYIKLLEFKTKINDEIIFKVLNSNKVNLDIDYENINNEKGKELIDIIDSVNTYINYVNEGKKLISNEFNKINIDVSFEDSFEKIASEISKLVNTNKTVSTDFGILFSKPYYDLNISFNLGNLVGSEIEENILPTNLGTLFKV